MTHPTGSEQEPPIYPSYIQNQHHDWLTGDNTEDHYPYNIKDYIENLLDATGDGANPYSEAAIPNPGPYMLPMRDAIDAYSAQVTASIAELDWDAMVDEASAKVDELGIAPTPDVSDMVDAYENAQLDVLGRNVNRFAAGMVEANAVNSSAYIIGMALIEKDHLRDVASFRARAELQAEEHAARNRSVFVLQAVDQLTRLTLAKMDAKKSDWNAITETNRINWLMAKEYVEGELSIAVEDALWDLEIFKYGQNMLGAVGGLAQQPPRLPKMASALSGAMAGLSMVGPMLPMLGPAGLAVGALAMGLGGYSGYLQGY